MNQIQSTKNYKQFKKLRGNRAIYRPHLNQLIKSIQEENMLAYNPIEVTENMEVVDGQHRLEAAKLLKVEIYYLINPKATIQTTTLENTALREWKNSDYLNKYIELGYQEYIDLAEFAKEYNISVALATWIGFDEYLQPQRLRKEFAKGRFAFKDREKAHNVASFVNELKKYCEYNEWGQREFLRALDVMIKSGVDQKKFLYKLQAGNQVLTRRESMKDYVREFEDVLDWKSRTDTPTRLY